MTVRLILFWCALAAGCGGGSSPATPDAAASEDAMGSMKYVFVTSADFTGGFAPLPSADGLMVADQHCQNAGVGAGMPGTWHAWLGRHPSNDHPRRTALERVTGDGPWYLPGTNEIVFLNRSALAATPRVPINRDEHGAMVTSGRVWTATNVGGDVMGADCVGWVTSSGGIFGAVGELSSNGSQWTYTGEYYDCEKFARLYCFQM